MTAKVVNAVPLRWGSNPDEVTTSKCVLSNAAVMSWMSSMKFQCYEIYIIDIRALKCKIVIDNPITSENYWRVNWLTYSLASGISTRNGEKLNIEHISQSVSISLRLSFTDIEPAISKMQEKLFTERNFILNGIKIITAITFDLDPYLFTLPRLSEKFKFCSEIITKHQ